MTNTGLRRAVGVIERSPVALTLADLSEPDAPLVEANARFEALTGFALDRVRGRNCRFLQRPGENLQARSDIRIAIERRDELQVILRNYRADGTPFENLLFLNPVRIAGHDYMLGSQFELSQSRALVAEAERHAGALADDLQRIAEKADRLMMDHRRHLAETAAFLVGSWVR